jgi:tetratricopeptide (TPR) repeat protein
MVQTVIAGICLVLLCALVTRYWRQYPYLLTGWLWYLVTLVPVIGLVQVGLQSRADRYTYIPLTGVFIALVWSGADLGKHWRISTRILAVISCAIVITLSLLCFRQVSYWQNSRTLFTHTYAVTERNYMADMILGNSFFTQRDFPAAINHYQRALRAGANGGVVHLLETKLATCYGVQGMFDDAIYHYQLALQANPQHANTYYLIGQLQETKGNDTEAINNFRRSIELDPGQLEANLALAQTLQRQGDVRGALTSFYTVLRQQPENPDALYAIGVSEARQGNTQRAADYFSRALRQRPTFIDAQRSLELLQSNPAK